MESGCKMEVTQKSGVKEEREKKQLECSAGNGMYSITQFNMQNERTAGGIGMEM